MYQERHIDLHFYTLVCKRVCDSHSLSIELDTRRCHRWCNFLRWRMSGSKREWCSWCRTTQPDRSRCPGQSRHPHSDRSASTEQSSNRPLHTPVCTHKCPGPHISCCLRIQWSREGWCSQHPSIRKDTSIYQDQCIWPHSHRSEYRWQMWHGLCDYLHQRCRGTHCQRERTLGGRRLPRGC